MENKDKLITLEHAKLIYDKIFKITIVNQLPETGDASMFYLIPKSSGKGYDKYWWVTDEEGNSKWDVFGGSSTLVVNSLPETGDEDTDYYMLSSSGTYAHYRWINNSFYSVGSDSYTKDETDEKLSDVDDTITEINSAVNAQNGRISVMEASVGSLGNLVSDVTENDSGIVIYYKDGSHKNVVTKSSSTTVEDVSRSESGITITYTDGDTKDIEISGGGGGTTVSGSASITRITDSSTQCVYGDNCVISYSFSALDSAGDAVGDGTATWYVGNVRKATSIAHQGENSFDIGDYLSVGSNNIKLSISVDTGGDVPIVVTKTWTVNAVNMYITWDYNDATINESDTVAIRWTPYGDLSKTTHIIIDGTEYTTSTTTRSGVQQYVTINRLSHGSHMVQLYCTATVNNEVITSDSVYHDMIFVDSSSSVPIISSSFVGNQMTQYNTLPIPVVIYTPGQLTSNAVLKVNGTQVAEWTNVDRTVHYWNYTPNDYGQKTLTITSGATTKTINLSVSQLNIDNEEITGYTFKLKASDIAGNEALQSWSSNGTNASFSGNFDWNNGGIQTETDDDGNLRQYICVKAGTRMTINNKLFSDDARVNGKNFKMIFKVKNCRDYDAEVMKCYSDNIGVQLSAHNASFSSSGTSLSVPYGEDEYIELEFDVYPASAKGRYMMAWIDGVITTARVYSESDNFTQGSSNQQNIIIGSDDCDVYVYMVKAYPTYITRDNHIENFIADAPNAQEMVKRYNRNNILDASGEIDYEKLATQNPDCRVWLYDIPRLTQGKKDYVDGCSFQQIWENGDQYYQLTGVGRMSIQGTSSVDYLKGAANTDINFGVEGAELKDGNGNNLLDDSLDIKGFKIHDDSEPITYSNTKVNFASCEQVNNMCNAEWYQKFQPYKSLTARDCMEFSMGVQFINDRSGDLWDDNKYHMYSIANMGTSKKNVHVFHDTSNPKECCIEVNNNLNDQCRMISDDLTDEDWSGDFYFGMRYPDTKNPSDDIKNGWQRFLTWMATNNPNAATGARLASPVTYGVYTFKGHSREGKQVLKGTNVTQYAGTYTHDTFNYRMAKMLNECEDYMIMDSVVYHFVYLERHTMVDNVAKNSFWSSSDLLHWDLSKAYDMDTSDGNNNEGQMVFDYGNEATDTIGTKTVFNAADSVWFVFISNLYEACQTMFIDREAAGAWDKTAYHNYLLGEQQKVPERVWVQCYWYDYLRTYEDGVNQAWISFLDGGQKTHQRWHYETFEEAYDASKYRGTACTVQNVTIRGYTPNTWTGVEPKSQVSIKMYNKCYIVIRIDQIYKSIKAERGQTYTIDFSDVGALNDTVINFYTAQMIQEIGDLSPLYPGFCSFANATRLRSLQVGSAVQGYSNTNLESLDFGNNTMLEYLYVQNLPNANAGLDLSRCPSLLYLDATGSSFTGYDFATGGLLKEAYLQAPTAITLRNLYYLENAKLHILDYSNLSTIRLENCPEINSLALVNNSSALARVRILGVDWELATTDVLNRLLGLIGIVDSGYNTDVSVLTGQAYVSGSIRNQELTNYANAWDNLEVTYNAQNLIEQYLATYVNADGSTLYTTYVDRGSTPPNPVALGLIPTPTQASTAQYNFTYSGWNDITSAMLSARTIVATYTQTTRTYTVTWYSRAGLSLGSVNAEYGSEVVYPGDTPTNTSEEGSYIYNVFAGWDKSTGYIKGDTDVYAIWDRAGLPSESKELEDMSCAEIYAVCTNNSASNYFDDKDHFDIQLGHDFNFSNVESQTLLENKFFDGTEAYDTNITLFDADSPSFTLAVDYEFINSNDSGATLISCFEEQGSEGFILRYNSAPIVQWGDKTLTVGHSFNRTMLVLRHVKGSRGLFAYASNISDTTYDLEITSFETVRNRDTSSANTLSFGAVRLADGSGHDYYAKGWIHWAKIWFDDLGDNIAKKLAAWPHETLRMEYTGANRYRLAGSTSQKANGSFLANNPLKLLRRMNSSNTNAGGWDASEMRTFLNTRVLNALPIKWQSAIKKVKISASSGNMSNEILVSEDYIYLAANREVGGYTNEPYASEGDAISFYTSNTSRIKIPGFIIEDDAQVITTTTEPTQLSSYNAKEGNIWINPNNSSTGYIYVSAETLAKHSKLTSYTYPNSDVYISASDGGCWVRAYGWWERSPIASNSTGFMFVNSNGYPYNYYAASTNYGVVVGFSI